LGDGPFVIKDHVKSAKHRWHEACFVPKGAGRDDFEQVAENLKRDQGKSFFRGFVVMQYVLLRQSIVLTTCIGSMVRMSKFCPRRTTTDPAGL
jgi:hypothetical protein